MENNYPEKVVIVAGPSFGSAMSFMLFGAALGAGAALLYKSQNPGVASAPDAIFEGISVGGTKPDARSRELTARLAKLTIRVKKLAGTARNAAAIAGTTALPAIRNAVEEGKRVARGTQEEIHNELENEPDTIYATPTLDAEINKEQA